MLKIKRFKMKPDADISVFPWGRIPRIIYGKVSYVNENSVSGFWEPLFQEISVIIAFPENLSEWNDFDYILVLDEDFCQPYGEVIETYNEFVSSLIFLEEIEQSQILQPA